VTQYSMKPKTQNHPTRKSWQPSPDLDDPNFASLCRNDFLGRAVLAAETASGAFEILAQIDTLNEGIDLAGQEHARRPQAPDPMHVVAYQLWVQDCKDERLRYRMVLEIRDGDALLSDLSVN